MDQVASLSTKQASGISRRRSAAKKNSSEPYQARRKEIADAAIRVFNRLGFTGTSMGAVAAELSIDRASIYYYISSKEELFDEVVRAVIERNAALARRVADSPTRPAERMRELIVGLMTSYGEHYPLIYIYIRENLAHVSDDRSEWSIGMRKLNRTIEDAVIQIIEQGRADGSFRPGGSSRIIAYGILGVIGWTHRWFRPATSDISAEQVGRDYADLLLGGLEAG